MASTETYRKLVTARAGGACEYCRLLEYASGFTYHIEHVIPLASGGETVISNLALSCPGCNLSKSNRTTGMDESGNVLGLYNPRCYQPSFLGWHLHFSLDLKTGRIIPRTSVGIATVSTLNMNSRLRTSARKLQIDAGLIA